VSNVVQANLLAATTENAAALGEAFNVAFGRTTTLLELHDLIAAKLRARHLPFPAESPVYHPPRPGDIQHSGADTSKIRRILGYEPEISLEAGLEGTVDWYLKESP
ncbi:MAG TPA: LPS biosynthesis protein WbpP, partial [Chthoniobacteraceae bacterium]|nr:LPS biosynthesis protein WbpP [Chthoniobacteraceae bacterium]